MSVRIVAGRLRNRRIECPKGQSTRPTLERVREALFSILGDIEGNTVVDFYAGSGALGFEALSRGAAHVTFVDREPRVARHLAETLERLGGADARIVTSDAQRYLERAPQQPFDVVFLDPPFGAEVLPKLYPRLAAGWLSSRGFVYVECPADAPVSSLPENWLLYRSKRAGQVGYHLLQVSAPSFGDPS